VDCYLRLIEPLKSEVKFLSSRLKREAGNDPNVRLLTTIPGVGYYVALLVKAEIGDVRSLGSGDHLASYAGLVPSTRSSGGVERHGGITRQGLGGCDGPWWRRRWCISGSTRRLPASTMASLRGGAERRRWWLRLGSWRLCVIRCWCTGGRTLIRWMLRRRLVCRGSADHRGGRARDWRCLVAQRHVVLRCGRIGACKYFHGEVGGKSKYDFI